MKQYLYQVLESHGALTAEQMLLYLAAATALGFIIYVSYAYTHSGTAYSRKFNVSLVVLTVLTCTVMTVIGNNVALSLGMVGALSIVRFRTAIKDSRDTMYIFWAIIVGICCGVGDYLVAALGSAFVFVILLVLGRVRNENRILLVIRGAFAADKEIEGVFFSYYKARALLRVKNTTKDNIELIYELSRSDYEKGLSKPKTITEKLYALGSVEYVNIVTQSDEING